MNSKILSEIKNKLKTFLEDKEILDLIIFGSAVKGKALPRDIDVAVVSDKQKNVRLEGFHFSFLKPSEFFIKPPTIATSLVREGYSLKNKMPLSEVLRFKSKTLFVYSLVSLKNSEKVRIVNLLKGKGKVKGLVNEHDGEWLANQTFFSPIDSDYLFEKFFIANEIKFKKYSVLIH